MGVHATYEPGYPARPDWVMLGVPHSDGKVALYASKKLSHAEMVAEVEAHEIYEDWAYPSRLVMGQPTYTISAVTSEFVVIVADDYNAAFRGLWEHWQPERTQRPEIEARRELPRGAPTALSVAPPPAIEHT